MAPDTDKKEFKEFMQEDDIIDLPIWNSSSAVQRMD